MLWIPASFAFLRQAAPDSESRLTIIRTETPSLIMESQVLPNLATSPSALVMIDSMPASSNAFFRLGRSLASQRGEVTASGRITPTFLAASPPSPPLSLLSLPHAERDSAPSTPTAARATRRLVPNL